MGKDAALRSSIVGLAIVIVIIGISTQSIKKMMVTYVMGMLLIGGVLLPDWDHFNRDFSRWCYAVDEEERAAATRSRSNRIKPVRVIGYTMVYGIALYKWWVFISN